MTKFCVVALLSVFFLPSISYAQSANETKALVNRIDQLESQIQTLSQSSYSSGDRPPGLAPTAGYNAAGSSAVGGLEVRMTGLEDQMRTLNGQIEKQTYDISQLKNRMDKVQGDLEQRLTALEQKSNAAPPAPMVDNSLPPSDRATAPAADHNLTDPSDTRDTKGSSAAATPDQEYEAAYTQLQRHDYIGADSAFRAFIKKYPSNPLDSNAQYWLGESLYARGKYNEASAAFAEGYSKYPKGAKAPDTLLKLGVSLGDAKKTKESCTVLRQLAKDFPTAPEAVASRAESEMKKQKCP